MIVIKVLAGKIVPFIKPYTHSQVNIDGTTPNNYSLVTYISKNICKPIPAHVINTGLKRSVFSFREKSGVDFNPYPAIITKAG